MNGIFGCRFFSRTISHLPRFLRARSGSTLSPCLLAGQYIEKGFAP